MTFFVATADIDRIRALAASRMVEGVTTIPPAVLRQLASHPLTDKGLAQFRADWEKTGQSIL
jgi:transaldolase